MGFFLYHHFEQFRERHVLLDFGYGAGNTFDGRVGGVYPQGGDDILEVEISLDCLRVVFDHTDWETRVHIEVRFDEGMR